MEDKGVEGGYGRGEGLAERGERCVRAGREGEWVGDGGEVERYRGGEGGRYGGGGEEGGCETHGCGVWRRVMVCGDDACGGCGKWKLAEVRVVV